MTAALIYLFIAFCAVRAAGGVPRRRDRRRRLARVTLLVMLGGYLLQLLWEPALPLFRRDAARIADGEVWRLLTTHVFHAWGLRHLLANLALLGALGTVTESRFGAARWGIFAVCGAAGGTVAALVWSPVGAGSSFALLGLAGGCLGAGGGRVWRPIGLAVATVLTVLGDPHGVAVIVAALVGAALPAPGAPVAGRGPHGRDA
ncbi:rhomboid family intramembrane serine protease [Mesobaculum littorinae]|uniref:Rhomboid family intramembrane serine protease n=1 Tax=Mesobaculum littorinae TaxID=2486419 RepID=A0A438AKM9_9RHOB|nr:rhomboid family intramembrane serine protease [Mesobaculum littorinae]RVV99383.1 rhomboid family intramembrane serine protease [Mesobaculum littorinae]